MVLSAVRLAECLEPDVEPGRRGIALPHIGKMYATVERMKGLASRVDVYATVGTQAARATVSAVTDSVSISTTYEGLKPANMVQSFSQEGDEEDHDEDSEDQILEATVDVRNLSRSLYGYVVQPKHTLCFVFSHCMLIHLIGEHGLSMSYYIPCYIQ